MAGSTSLGAGIGLQRPQQDDSWMKRLADDGVRENEIKRKEKDKEQADIAKLSDFAIDSGKYLPKYGKAITEIYNKMYNNIAAAKQGGSHLSRGQALQIVNAAKQEMAIYEIANERAMTWIKDKTIRHDDNLVREFMSSDGTVRDLAQYSDGVFNQIGENGEFTYVGVPLAKSWESKYNQTTDYESKINNNRTIIGGKVFGEADYTVTDLARNRETEKYANDPEFKTGVIYDAVKSGTIEKRTPGESYDDWLKRVDAQGLINTAASEIAERSAVSYKKQIPGGTLPKGPTANKDKRTKPVIQEGVTANTVVSKNDPSYKEPTLTQAQKDELQAMESDPTTYTKEDVDSKRDEYLGTQVGTTKYDISASVEGAPEVTLNYSDKMRDSKTNNNKKFRGKTGSFVFKPSRLISVKMNSGGYKLYVTGDATELDDKGDKTTKSNSWQVPYESVKSDLDIKFDLTEFMDRFGELSNTKQTSLQGGNNTSSGDWVESILDFEDSKGYSNFGFTSYSGSLSKSQAKDKFNKEYMPIVKDLPKALQPVAADFAFNSEDPRASLMVASGVITVKEKQGLYSNGKLDKNKVNDLWSKRGKVSVDSKMNSNPTAFLDAFDNERLRSYKNTNGSEKFYDEWAERVQVSRKQADKLLGGNNKKQGLTGGNVR